MSIHEDQGIWRGGSISSPMAYGKPGRGQRMEVQSCFKCGRYLPPGSLRYVVQIKIFADFDGFLSIRDEDIEGEIDRILEDIESRNPNDLENEVYQEIGLLL
jgi:hypothetical protein